MVKARWDENELALAIQLGSALPRWRRHGSTKDVHVQFHDLLVETLISCIPCEWPI
ncbi:hypothetical protein BDZ89DRAFT_1067954 [Hymenopellis radicata]|nr:hypothetical protein BDZ89DRAFT_1067954 [Hymenopellis radicata]